MEFIQANHFLSRFHQTVDEMGADKTGSTGYQIARDRRRHGTSGAGLKANELLFELLAEESHGADQAFFQGDSGGPTQQG